jgi:cysteine desulfurase
MRSSTVNVPAIFGFFKAFELCNTLMKKDYKKLSSLSDKIYKELPKLVPNSFFNVSKDLRIPNTINVRFDYIEGESLVYLLDNSHIGVSTGSACASSYLKASGTLLSMGLNPEQAAGSIRISLGRFTTKEEVSYLLKTLPKVVEQLRKVSPFKKNIKC